MGVGRGAVREGPAPLRARRPLPAPAGLPGLARHRAPAHAVGRRSAAGSAVGVLAAVGGGAVAAGGARPQGGPPGGGGRGRSPGDGRTRPLALRRARLLIDARGGLRPPRRRARRRRPGRPPGDGVHPPGGRSLPHPADPAARPRCAVAGRGGDGAAAAPAARRVWQGRRRWWPSRCSRWSAPRADGAPSSSPSWRTATSTSRGSTRTSAASSTWAWSRGWPAASRRRCCWRRHCSGSGCGRAGGGGAVRWRGRSCSG